MKKTKPTTIKTRDELENVLGEYAAAAIERAKLGATMDAKLNEIRAAYEERFAGLDETLEGLFADLEAWAALHRDEFADRRSLDLLHGTIGFRTGNPAVKPLKGVKWEHVVDQLRAAHLDAWLRAPDPEVNKEAVLAARETLGADRLAQLGMRVEQTERFFVDPKIEGAQA